MCSCKLAHFVWQMSIAAVAHIFVFSTKPYHYLPIYEHGKVISEEINATMKLEEDGKEKPATVKQMETHVESPGTSVTESVQDIVIGGGGHVSSLSLCVGVCSRLMRRGFNLTLNDQRLHLYIHFLSDFNKSSLLPTQNPTSNPSFFLRLKSSNGGPRSSALEIIPKSL
ncbi:hypothetical protein IFM89_020752 [Coptis chinensis]|uniref:Uncharacterized protein n=1 Tax=Coptis chinensis TaxID=261450 RepID=A0A835M5Q2_9MAGN|nr:hypothetical protein IFM89_020752 [Coptis chinensis]